MGQSGPENLGTADEVEQSGELITLYQCFPFCSGVPPIPLPPPEPFSGTVVESSTPHIGAGYNGPVEGATVTLTGSMDSPITKTTNAAGQFGGTYQPPSVPTAFATKYGVSTSGAPASTLTLYTDVTTKVGLTADSAPAALGKTFQVSGRLHNGATGSTAKALYEPGGMPALVKIPRNSAGGQSSLTLTGIDAPRFTWFGEAPSLTGLSQSGNAGGSPAGVMRVRAMHKWVKVVVSFEALGNEPTNDVKLHLHDYVNLADGSPSYADTTRFGLPTVVTTDSGTTLAQPNPTAAGTVEFYVWTANRLGTAAAPYKAKFRVHAESGRYISNPQGDNETIELTDQARISGLITKKIKLSYKDVAK